MIRRWWERWPDANVAIVTGEIEPGRFLSVVDCDVKPGEVNGLETLERLRDEHNDTAFRETWQAFTGGGGRHFYFDGEHAIPTTTSAHSGVVGIDTRGGFPGGAGRGYAVAPPSVHESGRRYRWDVGTEENSAPCALPPWLVWLYLGLDERNAERVSGVRRAAQPGRFAGVVPGEWREGVALVARAALRVPDLPGIWHDMFNAIAGALCWRGVSPSIIPALVVGISKATGADTKDRSGEARSTVRRWCDGGEVTGAPTLRRHPALRGVAVALERAIQHARQLANPKLRSLEEGAELLDEALASPALHVAIEAPAGAGKSRAMLRYAGKRAALGRTANGAVMPHSRTVLFVPTHKLAIDLFTGAPAQELRAQGVTIARYFSPASAKDADGRPLCKLHRQAERIAQGGLSVRWELCRGREKTPCPHYETCPARDGVEGDPNAHVLIAPYELARAVLSEGCATAAVLADEPPNAMRAERITTKDVDALRVALPDFEHGFREVLAPLVARLACGFEAEGFDASDGHVSPLRVFERAQLEALGSWRNASGGEPSSPPVLWSSMIRARSQYAGARAIGDAARVAWLLYRVARVATADVFTVALERGALSFMGPNKNVEEVARQGLVRFADARIDWPSLYVASGIHPSERETRPTKAIEERSILIRDRSPTSRHMIEWRSGSRTKLTPHGAAPNVALIARGLAVAIETAAEDADAQALFIASYMAVEGLILAAREATEREGRALLARGSWASAADTEARVDELVKLARERIAPVLASWPGVIETAHYQALRGLNRWTDFDAFITLGDANLNMAEVERVAAHLQISAEGRGAFEAARELEQAHGRARAPSRSKGSARLIHLGSVRPYGVGWDACERRQFPVGRRAELDPATAAAAVERFKSQREAARELGRSLATVQAALARGGGGDRKPPRKNESSTRGFPVTPTAGEKTQSDAQNPRQSNETGTQRVGEVSGHKTDRAGTTRGGRPRLAPAARMEATAMNTEEFEIALVKLCRRLGKNRGKVAVALGLARETLSRYASGKRPIPAELAAKVRAMLEAA